MKKFVLTTKSESGDDYIYLIEHKKQPTMKELDKFLMINGCDMDEERTYEDVVHLEEIKEFETIPS